MGQAEGKVFFGNFKRYQPMRRTDKWYKAFWMVNVYKKNVWITPFQFARLKISLFLCFPSLLFKHFFPFRLLWRASRQISTLMFFRGIELRIHAEGHVIISSHNLAETIIVLMAIYFGCNFAYVKVRKGLYTVGHFDLLRVYSITRISDPDISNAERSLRIVLQ